MTGMDVLRRCRGYEDDMARLRLRLRCARDAVTRITRSTEATGHGTDGDKMAEYAARIDEIEREIREREAACIADVETAARLVAQLPPDQGSVMHMRMVLGMTVRQTAAHMRQTESAVRGLYRRGREALEGKEV